MRGPDVRDEADLDDYMFEVAGRVGHMLTHIFAWRYRDIAAVKDSVQKMYGKRGGPVVAGGPSASPAARGRARVRRARGEVDLFARAGAGVDQLLFL